MLPDSARAFPFMPRYPIFVQESMLRIYDGTLDTGCPLALRLLKAGKPDTHTHTHTHTHTGLGWVVLCFVLSDGPPQKKKKKKKKLQEGANQQARKVAGWLA